MQDLKHVESLASRTAAPVHRDLLLAIDEEIMTLECRGDTVGKAFCSRTYVSKRLGTIGRGFSLGGRNYLGISKPTRMKGENLETLRSLRSFMVENDVDGERVGATDTRLVPSLNYRE